MYRVVIVDDNDVVLRSLSSTVEWKRLDCMIVGTCASGRDALVLIKQTDPHIVISDIRMPGLSGLELAQRTREECPEREVILITGFDEFEYARAAIKLGVVDFLLKPLDNEEIEAAVSRARRRIADREQQGDTADELRQSAEEAEQRLHVAGRLAREKAIGDLANGMCPTPEQAEAYAHSVGLSLPRFRVMAAFVRGPYSAHEPVLAARRQDIYDVVTAMERLYETQLHPSVLTESIVFLERVGSSSTSHDSSDTPRLLADRLSSQEHLPKFVLGASNLHTGMHQVHGAYAEAAEAAAESFFSSGTVFAFSATRQTIAASVPLIDARIREFESSLSVQCVRDRQINDLDAILEQISAARSLGFAYVRRQLDRLRGILLSRQMRSEDALAPVESFDECRRLLHHLTRSLASESPAGDEDLSSRTQRMMRFILAHYAEKISIDDLAANMELSTSQVARALKRELGRGFTQVLNETRIRKAIELLQTTNAKAYEIAPAVGIDSYAYFCQVFKKYSGRSPRDFR